MTVERERSEQLGYTADKVADTKKRGGGTAFGIGGQTGAK